MALLAGSLVWQLWQLWGVRSGRGLLESELLMPVNQGRVEGTSLKNVAALHLFGNPADKPSAEPAQPEVLPVTDLKFVLVGAISDSDPAKASALISAENAVQRYYIGDDIRGQASLHEVRPDSVVLKRANRFEVLEFAKAGDMSPDARESFAKLMNTKGNIPVRPGVAVPVQTQPAAPTQVQQPAATTDTDAARQKEKTGRTLRDKLQKRPKNTQKPPGS
jgi:type II secretory pathway component PulC